MAIKGSKNSGSDSGSESYCSGNEALNLLTDDYLYWSSWGRDFPYSWLRYPNDKSFYVLPLS